MKEHPRRPRRWGGLLALTLPFALCSCGMLALWITALVTPTCSFIRGECQYDPRTQQPSSLFIEQPPEPYVVQFIQDQIKSTGAINKVVAITPTLVTASGFNTDWHVTAKVYVDVHYLDGSIRQQVFDVMAVDSRSWLFEDSMRARFGPLKQEQCRSNNLGKWSCW